MRAWALVLLAGCGRYGFTDADAGGVVVGGDGPIGTGDGALPDAVPVTGNLSCAGIKNDDPAAASGVYTIDPDGGGPGLSLPAYCDMTTDGGGWTLVLSYVHRGGTAPALNVRATSLPLFASDTLGADESGSEMWGHAAPAMVARLPVSQLRFSCRSGSHARVLDFVTTSAMCIDYARTGTGGCLDIRLTSAPLPGHTAMLPAETTHVMQEAADLALTYDPFYKNTMPKANWAVSRDGTWECDAQASGTAADTIHRVWVR